MTLKAISALLAVSLCTLRISPVSITTFPVNAFNALPEGIGRFLPIWILSSAADTNFTSTVILLFVRLLIVKPIIIVVVYEGTV